jgi:hypothetical protein
MEGRFRESLHIGRRKDPIPLKPIRLKIPLKCFRGCLLWASLIRGDSRRSHSDTQHCVECVKGKILVVLRGWQVFKGCLVFSGGEIIVFGYWILNREVTCAQCSFIWLLKKPRSSLFNFWYLEKHTEYFLNNLWIYIHIWYNSFEISHWHELEKEPHNTWNNNG